MLPTSSSRRNDLSKTAMLRGGKYRKSLRHRV